MYGGVEVWVEGVQMCSPTPFLSTSEKKEVYYDARKTSYSAVSFFLPENLLGRRYNKAGRKRVFTFFLSLFYIDFSFQNGLSFGSVEPPPNPEVEVEVCYIE